MNHAGTSDLGSSACHHWPWSPAPSAQDLYAQTRGTSLSREARAKQGLEPSPTDKVRRKAPTAAGPARHCPPRLNPKP